MEIISRLQERHILDEVLLADRAELVIVYGRRRVGKTFLIHNFFNSRNDVIYFQLTGQKNEDGSYLRPIVQLANFKYQFEKAFQKSLPSVPSSWQNAFFILRNELESDRAPDKRIVLFFDELPWLSSPKSGFYESLDQAWNVCFEKLPQVKVILAGSATSWMLKQVVHARAGFSRRLSKRIALYPFTLGETREFLNHRGYEITNRSVADIYMMLGGIPYYLDFLSPHKSVAQNIDDECFKENGRLVDEYQIVFNSLFKNALQHKDVIEFLIKRYEGATKLEIISAVKKKSITGGTVHRIIENLLKCDFIRQRPPLYNEKRGALYSVSDEFTIFHHKWIKPTPKSVFSQRDRVYFQAEMNSPSFRSWLGFAFENLCLKHEHKIRRSLGIDKIKATYGSLYLVDVNTKKRISQIDLLFDRADRTITICEMKYSDSPFEITKKVVQEINQKKEALKQYLATKKQPQKDIQVCFVTTNGVKPSSYYRELSPQVITLDELF